MFDGFLRVWREAADEDGGAVESERPLPEMDEGERVFVSDLRHSFASRALALGEGLPMIGKLLGHTQVQTTARYAHLARDTMKVSAARIGDSIDRDLEADGGVAEQPAA